MFKFSFLSHGEYFRFQAFVTSPTTAIGLLTDHSGGVVRPDDDLTDRLNREIVSIPADRLVSGGRRPWGESKFLPSCLEIRFL